MSGFCASLAAIDYVALSEWSQVAASILFIGILVFIWMRFIAPGIVRSQARKNAELAEAEHRRDAAKADIETAHREIASIEEEIGAIGARSQSDAAHLRERILAQANAEGERLVGNAEGELERGRAAARERVREVLIARALDIARSAGTYLDEATNRRLVGETAATAERGNAP